MNHENYGAGDGVRTRDPKLGKLVLYQLSYARFSWPIITAGMDVVNPKKMTTRYSAALMSRSSSSSELNPR